MRNVTYEADEMYFQPPMQTQQVDFWGNNAKADT
jgi:hypothetical protein